MATDPHETESREQMADRLDLIGARFDHGLSADDCSALKAGAAALRAPERGTWDDAVRLVREQLSPEPVPGDGWMPSDGWQIRQGTIENILLKLEAARPTLKEPS